MLHYILQTIGFLIGLQIYAVSAPKRETKTRTWWKYIFIPRKIHLIKNYIIILTIRYLLFLCVAINLLTHTQPVFFLSLKSVMIKMFSVPSLPILLLLLLLFMFIFYKFSYFSCCVQIFFGCVQNYVDDTTRWWCV